MSSTADIYRRAADRVERRWAKGKYTNRRGGVCMVKAVLIEAGIKGDTLPDKLATEIHAYLRQIPSFKAGEGETLQDDIMSWNDAKPRIKEDVIQALRGLADSLDAAWRQRVIRSKPLAVKAPRAAELVAAKPRERELVAV